MFNKDCACGPLVHYVSLLWDLCSNLAFHLPQTSIYTFGNSFICDVTYKGEALCNDLCSFVLIAFLNVLYECLFTRVLNLELLECLKV